MIGDRQLDARWQQQAGTWAVDEVVRSPASQFTGALLHVDHPVARLPYSGPVTSSSAEVLSSIHRVSLLLQHPGAASLSFLGSDADAPVPHPSELHGDQTAALHCVARGPWGTCLPVEVAHVQSATETVASDDGLPECPVSLQSRMSTFVLLMVSLQVLPWLQINV
jgi:hypothetical protein